MKLRGNARLILALAVGVVAAVVGQMSNAQRSGCERLPGNSPRPSGPPARSSEVGKFDYYALVMSWSPSYCAGLVKNDYDPQCNSRDGKRYSFVLHGLWPQLTRGYPESCPPGDKAFIPRPVIDRVLDIMPSARLAIHEYKKHGSCSGLDPAGYFDFSRKLFTAVKVPARFVNPQAAFFISPDDLKKEFAASTPGLKPEMIGVSCGGPGDRLKEIRICTTRDGAFTACGANEDQKRLCRSNRMYVPPVRVAAAQQ